MQRSDKDIYIRKYWDEEDIWFYIHYCDGYAVRQIEVKDTDVVKLSAENPEENLLLADQELDLTEFEKDDFISKEEFEEEWGR